MSDYSELKRLAESATPGPWSYDGSYVCPARVEDGTTYVETWRSVADCHQSENTKFIAAANPAAVLSLTAELDRLKSELAGLRTGYDAYEKIVADLRAENESLREGANFRAIQSLRQDCEVLREDNDKLARRNGMLEQNVQAMTEAHVLYTWLRKKCDQPSNDVVAVQMNMGHDWVPVRDLDRDLRTMIDREEP